VDNNQIFNKLQNIFPTNYRYKNVLLINADCMEVFKHINNNEFDCM
jgi:hypothetical protein